MGIVEREKMELPPAGLSRDMNARLGCAAHPGVRRHIDTWRVGSLIAS